MSVGSWESLVSEASGKTEDDSEDDYEFGTRKNNLRLEVLLWHPSKSKG